MSMQDLHGLPLSTASPEAARAFNHAVEGYPTYRADAPVHLRQLIAAGPEFGLARVLKSYFFMLSFRAGAASRSPIA